MARKTTPSIPPQPAQLTVEQMRSGISRLERRIEEVENFDPETVSRRFDSKGVVIGKSVEETFSRIFGTSSAEYDRYYKAYGLDHGPMIAMIDYTLEEIQSYHQKGKETVIALIKQAIRGLQEEIAEREILDTTNKTESSKKLSRKIFIVHGWDEHARETVARFVEKIGFEAIILHEQANRGRTIIEKVEAHGDVGFAIVLLTPDDVGGPKSGDMNPRARQNVILELGYFIGRLGRSHVCALKSGDMELPSDFGGVVYEPFDERGAWKQALARELQDIGFDINWNKVMGRG